MVVKPSPRRFFIFNELQAEIRDPTQCRQANSLSRSALR